MSYTNFNAPSARPRPRPQKPKTPDASRESGAIRASVLDAALQLGLGANPAVADWMFNNSLKEEDEDQIPNSPALTHSEESPISSPLSSRYPLTPSSPSSQNHSSNLNHNLSNFHLQHTNTVPFALSAESQSLVPHIADAASAPARPATPSKLKKKRNGNKDGNESDAGALSDAKRKKDKKKDKKNKDKDVGSNIPPLPALSLPPSSAGSFLTIPDGSSEMTTDSGEPRRRTKSLVKSPPMTTFQGGLSAPSSPFENMGYETDGGKKSKKKGMKAQEGEGDVKKARSLFFRLGNKSSKGDMKKGNVPERKDDKPPVLPIAEKFATTMNKENGAPMIGGSAGLGIDLDLGLSGDMFSTTTSPPPRSAPAPPTVTPSSPTRAQTPLPPPTNPPFSQPPPQSYVFNSTPPISFPSSTSNGRPNTADTSASVGTTTRTSTSTNTHSHSTGATRTSTATSISTSQSHTYYINGSASAPLKGVTSRDSSNADLSSLASGATFPQTPSKRRVLPFLGTPGKRASSSSGDSYERERRREKEERRKEKESKKEHKKDKGKEDKSAKKPTISFPLTRAGPNPGAPTGVGVPASDAPEVVVTSSNFTPVPTSAIPNGPSTPHRPRPANPPADGMFGVSSPRAGTHPPVSRHPIQSQGGLSRQVSMSTLRADAPTSPVLRSTSPVPMTRSTSPLPSSGRVSPMPRGMGLTVTVGSPPGSGRHSLLGPPGVFSHYDIPPPSPPPLSPLPSVPTIATTAANGFTPVPTPTHNGNLSVNVGIAVTTGSPLPSPLLMTSPNFSSSSGVNGSGSNGRVAPPSSFNPSSAAAGSALRARVQKRLSQQGGFPAPSGATNGAANPGANANTSTSTTSNIPVINAPPELNRSISIRGRESPFPIAPITNTSINSANSKLFPYTNSPSASTSTSITTPPRTLSPRSGWEDDASDKLSDGRQDQYEEDEDGMEDVREMLARFRESRIDDGWKKMEEEREASEGVIATRGSFEAFQRNGATSPASNSGPAGGGAVRVLVSPSPSSGLNVPMGSDRMSAASGAGYDNFVIEEYYGHGQGGSNAGAPGAARPEDEFLYVEDDIEDASYYPEDEITPSNRRSRRRRSTLYLSDEEHDNSSNSGHGHQGNAKTTRSSRWSGSIYSRASFLDTEKSGDARQRFLKHVEAMLDERGERVAVPPVPKLPEEFVAESKRAAAAAKQEYEEYMTKRTVGVGARRVPAGPGPGLGR